jgi:hypothetical protein
MVLQLGQYKALTVTILTDGNNHGVTIRIVEGIDSNNTHRWEQTWCYYWDFRRDWQ